MREAVIVSGVRTAVGRASKGKLRDTRPDDLAGWVIQEAVARVPGLEKAQVQDVIMGCAFPEAEQGMNVARVALLRAGLPDSVPGATINRFCSSGLEAIAVAAQRIVAGGIDVAVAGGVESMTFVPMAGNKVSLNPYMAQYLPDVYMGMGQTAEVVAERYGIGREEMDLFALDSQRKTKEAQDSGVFKSQILPLNTFYIEQTPAGPKREAIVFDTDECPRPETTLEGLAKLRPAFTTKGIVTAGNSSPLSDGAAALVLMERKFAEQMGLTPLATFRAYRVAGCRPDEMGIGPSVAVPLLMQTTGLQIADIDIWEMNEAFASQSVYCAKKLELDPAKLNVHGGAIALGHPLGCTGAKLSVQIIYEMLASDLQRGVVTMCIGGGMGAAGLFER
ncbi:MAG: thiolase family protein [Myxococcota bacterium]|jgi:acetyl-CoA acyltransferase|nr:thiolase family protein [Myxococcota bacterium]